MLASICCPQFRRLRFYQSLSDIFRYSWRGVGENNYTCESPEHNFDDKLLSYNQFVCMLLRSATLSQPSLVQSRCNVIDHANSANLVELDDLHQCPSAELESPLSRSVRVKCEVTAHVTDVQLRSRCEEDHFVLLLLHSGLKQTTLCSWWDISCA